MPEIGSAPAGGALPAGADGRSAPAARVSVVIPCRDEEATVGACVRDAWDALRRYGYDGEVIVVDNASADGSARAAAEAGARVVAQPIRGYGAACLRGMEEARGDVVVLMDADGTYDASALHRFVEPVLAGYDMVLGTRRNGEIEEGAMAPVHRHLLEPVQAHLLRNRFGVHISDVRCGMRAVRRGALDGLELGATGMEFASEMLVGAVRAGLDLVEVPVRFRPRPAAPRRSVGDGWRVARQLLLLSPTRLYLIPGMVLLVLGMVLEVALLPGPVRVAGITLDFHFMFVGSAAAILGLQLVLLGLYAKTYSLVHQRLVDPWIVRFHLRYTLERGAALGGALLVAGVLVNVWILAGWLAAGAGVLFAVRPAVFALTLMVLGAEIVFAAFFVSLLRGSEFGRV